MERKVKFLSGIIALLAVFCVISLSYNFHKEGCARTLPEPTAEKTTVAIELARASTTSKIFKADEEPAEEKSVSTPEVREETVTESNSTETEIIEDYTEEIKLNDTIPDYNSSDIRR